MASSLRRSSDQHDAFKNESDHVRRHSSIDGDTAEQAGLLRDAESERQLDDDLEKGVVTEQIPAAPPQNHEDTVSTKKKLIALAGYFICNIGLTIYNKAILGSVGFSTLMRPDILSPYHHVLYIN